MPYLALNIDKDRPTGFIGMLIRQWKPWNQSTGPQSELGKAAAAHNAFTGGHAAKLRQLIKEVNQALREQRDWLGR